MKILVKTSVNFHHRNACAMSIHIFFFGGRIWSVDRIALRSTEGGEVDVSGWRLLLFSRFWVSLLRGGRRHMRGARPELTDVVMQISIAVCLNLLMKHVLVMAENFVWIRILISSQWTWVWFRRNVGLSATHQTPSQRSRRCLRYQRSRSKVRCLQQYWHSSSSWPQ